MISAGVITAKVAWNMKKAGSGIEPHMAPRPPARNILPRPPSNGAWPSKARL